MSDFLEAVQYRTPDFQNFLSTLAECGTDVDKFDFVIHCLPWVKRQLSPLHNWRCNMYFSSPSIFMLILTKFNRAPPDDNTFKQFIELITIKRNRNDGNTPLEIDDLILQIRRITPATDNQTFYESDRGLAWTVRVESLRKKWLEYFKLYWKPAASWPVNKDTTVFETFRNFLTETLLIPRFSALETEYIDAYKKIESNLGTLTSLEMLGAGLPPMYLSFGPDLTRQQWEDFQTTYTYSIEADLPAWKASVTTAIRGVKLATDNLHEMDLMDMTYERHFKDDIKRFIFSAREIESYFNSVAQAATADAIPSSGIPELDRAAKDWYAKQITIDQINAQERRVINAEKTLETVVSGPGVFALEWQRQTVPTSDDGIMCRWYDWASQFWLQDAHSKWFNTIAKLSRSGEIQDIFQATQIILIDDASYGANRYTKFGLNVLSAPQLVYVFTLRNKSPWWRPPTMEESAINTDAAVDIEEIELETKRMEIIYGRLNDLKKSISEGLLLNNANVVFYTTTPSFIGYCLFNDIDIIIYNLWLSTSPISIKNLRNWILRDYNLCGQATRHVSTKTRLLTFIALLALSTSSGIPMYVGFGWDNIYSQWRNIVKEFSKLVPPSRLKADETCAWLAKIPDEEIIINKQLMVPLFARVLHSKFAGDKKPTPLKSDYTLWSSKYKELFSEERIGTGRVEPVPVLTSWNPLTELYYEEKEISSESAVRSRIKTEEAERRRLLDERYNRAMDEWRQNFAAHNAKTAKENNDEQQAERNRLRDKNIDILNKLQMLNDTQGTLEKEKEAVELNKKSRQRLQGKWASYPTKLKRLRDKQDILKQEMSSLTNYGWAMGGEGYEKTQEIARVAGKILELETDAQGWLKSINDLDTAIPLGEEGLKIRQTSIFGLKDDLNKFIAKDGDIGLAKFVGGVWTTTFILADAWSQYINNYIGLAILTEDEYATDIEERPTRVEIVTIDQSLEGSLKTDDMMPVTTISSVVKIQKDIEKNKTSDNTDASDALLKDIKCVEWAYAQRCHFQDHYYAPKDFDKLIITFGIRFKDWTGAKTITINN